MELYKVYNFSTKAASYIGSAYRNATLVAIMNYATAQKHYNGDLAALAKSIFPLLDDNTDRDHTKYTYYMFETASAAKLVIAKEWIVQDSIAELTSSYITAVVKDVTLSDLSKVRAVLAQAGYNDVSVSLS